MATQIQFRRGTSAQHNSFTGATAELTVNTTNKSVHVHDGTTQGGFELARVDLSNTSGLSLSGITTASNLNVSNNFYVSGISTFIGQVNTNGGLNVTGHTELDNVISSGIVTAIDFNATSDASLKDNIKPVNNASILVNKLEGVHFTWKENGKKSIGVIAQEVEKTLPELVSTGETKTVNYNGLIGVLIEAVKEQQKQIDELRNQIEDIKNLKE